MSLVEGRNPVLEILIAENLSIDPRIELILRLSKEHNISVEQVRRAELDKASATGHHQGVIAFIRPPIYVPLREILEKRKENLCLILLAEVQDPHNLGAILRTSEATGVDAVVISRHRSVGLTPAVHRTSMGGSSTVPIIRDNLYSALKLLKEEGVKAIGVDPEGTVDYYDENLSGSIAFVVGGEEKGLSASLIERCDRIVKIPMKGKLTSLNVSVATALVLYERMRQQSVDETPKQ